MDPAIGSENFNEIIILINSSAKSIQEDPSSTKAPSYPSWSFEKKLDFDSKRPIIDFGNYFETLLETEIFKGCCLQERAYLPNFLSY